MAPILYHTHRCRHTPAIRGFAERSRIQCEYLQITDAQLGSLDGAIYLHSPILQDSGKTLEDWRLIVRYLDEVHGRGSLAALPPEVQSELFELCDNIEVEISTASLELTPVAGTPLGRLLSPFFGGRKKHSTDPDARRRIAEAIERYRNDARLNDERFFLARLVFEGAVGFVESELRT